MPKSKAQAGPLRAGPESSARQRTDEPFASLENLQGQIAAIVESSQDVIICQDLHGRILTCNSAAERLLGYPAQEVIGRNSVLFIPENLRAAEAAIFARVRKGEHIQCHETIRLKKDGTPLAVLLTISPIRVAAGKIVGASKIIRGVRERKRLEQALQECEKRYLALFENMAEGLLYGRMLFKDGQPHDWLYLEVNHAFERLTGLRNVVGRKASEGVPGFLQSNPEWLEKLGRVAATGQQERFEAYSPSMTMWFSVSAYCPKPEHFVAVFENITERHQTQAALRESEAELKEAQRLANMGYWERDLVADRITWPAETSRLFGLPPQTLTLSQAQFQEMIHPADRQLQRQALAGALRGGRLYNAEFRIIRPDGEVRFVHVRDEIIFDASGQPIRMFGTVQDITERKELEAEVALREQQLNAFFTDAPAGLVLLDKRLRYVRLNNRVAEVNGVPVKDHLGKTVREVLPRFAPVIEPLLQQVLATGKPILNTELSGEKPDRPGRLQHLMESFFPIMGKDGKTDGVGVILVDITERKRAEEAVKEAKDNLRFVLDTTPAMIHTARPDGYLDYFNQPWLDYVGLPLEDMLGWNWKAVIHPEDVAEEAQRWRGCVASGEPFEHEVRVRRADGKYRWMLHRKVAMRDEQGKIVKWCGTGIDIDDRKQAEQSLRDSHAQLRALSARLQSVREEEATRIAREIHDDLGQQLTGLKMDLTRAERRLERLESSPAVNSLLDTIVNATELADSITASVQEIAANLRPEMLDKLGLSAALHYESRRFQERTGIVCETHLPETEPVLPSEVSTALFRIFQECLTNVARHARATKVEAALEVEDGRVRLRVRDNGRGITAAEVANPESLGLLGMKERTALLGGEIVFCRHPEGGTMVTVHIPQHKALLREKAPV